MVALLKREVGTILQRFGWSRTPDYRARPGQSIDYDALYADVAERYPKIMKRRAE